PRFNTEPWYEKEIIWKDKLFIKDKVKSVFHIPINFSKVIIRNMEKLEKEGAKNPENIMLSDEMSLWSSWLHIAVDKPIPNSNNEKISGTFLSKAFEGPYHHAGKWAKEMKTFVESKGKNINKLFFWYTTCPKCAKVYGKNYTVLFAQV
ncbi:MAG: hydrolase, partial [Bacteroidota bacterium]